MVHSPTLKTVIMVECEIQQAITPISVATLKKRLPKKVQHNTLKEILAYLEKNHKITVSLEGISWSQGMKEQSYEHHSKKSFYHG